MIRPQLRIVIDTNILISAALAVRRNRLNSHAIAILFKMVDGDEIVAIASQSTLYELSDKLSDPRFELPPSFIREYTELIADNVELVAIRGLDMGCRDDDDDKFIETAVNGRVDILVTRDEDLHTAQIRYDLAKRFCKVMYLSKALSLFDEMSQAAARKNGP